MLLKKSISTILLCFLLISCQGNNKTEDVGDTDFKREIEQGLVLYNAILEQSNAKGQILWRLSTKKAIYTQDKESAILDDLTGNLFENGKIILKVSAKKGEVKNEGKEIYLSGDIIAFDIRNKAEFKGDMLLWKPEENVMLMEGNQGITANHTKLVVKAKQAKYNTKTQLLELDKDILATTKNPSLLLKTQHLYWQIPENKIIGNTLLDMVRYDDKKLVTDKLKSNQAEIDLDLNVATINGEIEYQSLEPPLQVATNRITWYYVDRKMRSNDPTKLVQAKDNMTLTANNVDFNLGENQVYLQGGIYGQAEKNEVEIYADNLVWNLDNQQINADGNVFYKQINPDFNLRGISAIGKLQDKNITVKGNQDNPVTTIIYSNES
ncbi:LPS export ABC transporter periplasmic protein LptC [Geminocystis sp. NIES-3709]|uniref:LPS export ABC transporter periplasmic protein LptC n=1 Tax=Geminocystis sp. NIES-3709 TaxID=1617448 RepID=UPI0005FC6290|nr:LPS export ABC transporter periplasmic protein LptC [Geminocystis sp. NIES-3709]BAQ65747.1 homoserine dehydrogenase [Geminocystis sp. NIES-3709]